MANQGGGLTYVVYGETSADPSSGTQRRRPVVIDKLSKQFPDLDEKKVGRRLPSQPRPVALEFDYASAIDRAPAV
jgi:hypothetical protein